MQDIQSELQKAISQVLNKMEISDIMPEIERPKDSTHGDFSSNIAMKLSKELKKNPLEIAEQLVSKLQSQNLEFLEKSEAVRPGFINFYIKSDSAKEILNHIDENFGKSNLGEGKEVMIEFGQPNTHKAFHVGHLKSAVSGFSMVKLHENLGYKVIKANYFGDVGMQVAKPTWAFMQKEKPTDFDNWDIHEQMRYIDDCYVYGSTQFKENPEVEAAIRQINKDIYAKADNEYTKTYKYLREISLKHQADIWKTLGITYDREYPESEIYQDAMKIVEENKGKIFEESDGAIIFNGEKANPKLTTWVFETSEGNPTYSAKDLALANKKFEEYPNLFKGIVTTSIEIKDYFKVVIHVLGLIKPETKGRYFHIPFGWMLRSGKKFSSRMGGSIKGMDILNEVREISLKKVSEMEEYPEDQKQEISLAVANAGLKFLILSHEFAKDFSYDPEKFLSFQGFSGPYMLYSYARAKSILAKYDGEIKIDNFENVLNAKEEINVLKLISQYPEIAERAGVEITPHIVANYLYELAQAFNQFYTNLSVLNADNEADKLARLKLTESTAQVIKNGLNLLGIETVEKM